MYDGENCDVESVLGSTLCNLPILVVSVLVYRRGTESNEIVLN